MQRCSLFFSTPRQVIAETEGAYLKILESSQTLLTVLKRESVSMQKRRAA